MFATSRRVLWIGGLSALALAAALAVRHEAWLLPPPGAGLHRRLLYSTVRDGLLQIGTAGALLALVVGAWERVLGRRAGSAERRLRGLLLRLTLATAVFMVSGELVLRVVYRDGMSFSTHLGPIVQRYERDFSHNRFDGPSRGPAIAEDAAPSGLRVVVQGDSVTWGQGVKQESALYTSLLLDRLRRDDADAEMAVLATCGRNIDGHLLQLRKWGQGLAPDAIVYQWHVNDLEVDKSARPGHPQDLPWRRLFCHRLLYEYSYFWFFLDNRLAAAWPTSPYVAGMLERFESDTPAWDEFAELFRTWSEEAHRLTPRVLVVLYSTPVLAERFAPLRVKVERLARDCGVEVLDPGPDLAAWSANPRSAMATPFDPHPNAAVHAALADSIYRRLTALWPELVGASPALASAASGER